MTPQPELTPLAEPRQSTGPTTPEGKARSALNALRHGLSGQTVLMPWEDQSVYKTHCDEILASLAPIGKLETDAAQGFADDQWRLNRARAVDTNMFALGQFDYAPATGHSQIDAALNSARAFRDHSKAFVNISLYEQRINRSLEKNLARLQALQQDRRQKELDRELEEGMARAREIQQKVYKEHAAAQQAQNPAKSAPDPAGSAHRARFVPTKADLESIPLAARQFVYANWPASAPAANSDAPPDAPPASKTTLKAA
jgi:hypothetical protein